MQFDSVHNPQEPMPKFYNGKRVWVRNVTFMPTFGGLVETYSIIDLETGTTTEGVLANQISDNPPQQP